MATVLLCECALAPNDPALARLAEDGHQVIRCRDSDDLIEHALRRRPSAIVCHFRHGSHEMGMLHLLRRVAPDLPLIVISDEASLDDQRALQSLRPTYFAITPVEPEELVAAVRAAVSRLRAGGSAPS
jgi:DNA-binding NtrC family response regulator